MENMEIKLTGSEKQIAWAQDIIKNAMDKKTAIYAMQMQGNAIFKKANGGDAAATEQKTKMMAKIMLIEKEKRAEKLYDWYIEAASKMTSAAWWIDNRFGIVGTLATMGVKIWAN